MILALLLSLSSGPPAPRVDFHGDPLPYGAVARLGTIRFRHGHQVAAVAVSGDGKKIASGAGDHALRVWDRKTGKQIALLGGGPPEAVFKPARWVHTVALSPDGTRAACIANDGIVRCYDIAAQKELWQTSLRAPTYSGQMAFSPDGKLLAGMIYNSAFVLNAATGVEARRFLAASPIGAVAFSPDGKMFAAGTNSGTIILYDVDGWKSKAVTGVTGLAVLSLAFSPDNKKLAIGYARSFVVHDLATDKASLKVEVKDEARIIAYLDGGKRILTTGLEPSPLRIWDAATGKPVKAIEHRLGWVRKLVMCPDGRTAVISAAGRTAVFQFDLKTEKVVAAYPAHTGNVRILSFHAGGRRVLTGSEDGTLREWDAATGKPLWSAGPEGAGSATAARNGVGAVSIFKGRAEIWKPGKDKPLHDLDVPAGQARCAAFSPDGKFLVTSGHLGLFQLRDAVSGKLVRSWKGDGHDVTSVAFGPDGLIASTSSYPVISFRSSASGERVRLITGPPVQFHSLTFSRDGRYIACGDTNGRARVWEVATGQLLHEFAGLRGYVMAVAFSPDGRYLAAGEWFGIRVYSLADGTLRGQVHAHDGDVLGLAFSDDGTRLASGGSDSSALIWDVKRTFNLPKLETARKDESALAGHLRELDEADHRAAYRALWALAGTGDQAVKFLAGHIRPVRDPDAKAIAGLIAKLEDDDAAVRRRTQAELEGMRHAAEKAVREALKKAGDPDLKLRLHLVLSGLAPGADNRGDLRDSRAIQVLELVNTPAARKLLGELAKGAARAPRTRMARAALERLDVTKMAGARK
jgi:WD40 repeat protein